MFQLKPTLLSGCYEMFAPTSMDTRGTFTKIYHHDAFRSLNLDADFREQYYTVSHRHVVRGLHFQLPPHQYSKLVHCSVGEVLDVVVDLRVDSPTYGKHARVRLAPETANMVYIPSGMAHGFCVLSEFAVVNYDVTSVFAPDHDAGVRWDSAGIAWPTDNPIVSARDQALPPLVQFNSPFFLEEDGDAYGK
ncbi:MAG: dTDP-4-dehydrorhamnose 3,5-epimerase family protein [Bacilli bacterium]